MSWLQSLRGALVEAVNDLDQILDRVAGGFHRTVTLRIAEAAGELDDTIAGIGGDDALPGSELALTIRRAVGASTVATSASWCGASIRCSAAPAPRSSRRWAASRSVRSSST